MSRQSALWVRWIGTAAAGTAPSGGFEVNGCSKERDAASRLAGQSLSWKKRSICLWLLPPGLTRWWRLVGGAAWAHSGRVSAPPPLLHHGLHPLCRPPFISNLLSSSCQAGVFVFTAGLFHQGANVCFCAAIKSGFVFLHLLPLTEM